MVWNEETIVLLRELWAHGHSTAEIGRRLGVTKNAIVGKAHRLDLTARPSPIRRDTTNPPSERVPAPLRSEGPTLPPLASAVEQPASYPVQAIRLAAVAPPSPRPVPAPRPFTALAPASPPVRAVMPPASMQYRRSAPSCCWPIGEPGKRDFHFCDDPSIPGKPYCEEHAKLAYVKIRDRKEDAA
jgi:GcrA cell cycle regulator